MAEENRKSWIVCMQVLMGVITLLCGISIYLLFRSESISLYRWCAAAGFGDEIEMLRQSVRHWTIPDYLKYSLPDGLYCLSYILLMDAVWAGRRTKFSVCAVCVIPLVAITHELAQGLGLAKGTFDAVDLLSYSVPLILYLFIIRQ